MKQTIWSKNSCKWSNRKLKTEWMKEECSNRKLTQQGEGALTFCTREPGMHWPAPHVCCRCPSEKWSSSSPRCCRPWPCWSTSIWTGSAVRSPTESYTYSAPPASGNAARATGLVPGRRLWGEDTSATGSGDYPCPGRRRGGASIHG